MLHSLVTFCCENKQNEQHYSRQKMVSNTQGLDWPWETAESSYGNRGMAVLVTQSEDKEVTGMSCLFFLARK